MPELTFEDGARDSHNCPPVELQPFIHQVGGHTSMFRFNETTVCKPLCRREYRFYVNLPQEIRQFTAECRGIVEVEVRQSADRSAQLLAHPVEGPGGDWVRSNARLLNCPQTDGCRSRNGVHVSKTKELTSMGKEDQPDNLVKKNPWVESIYQRQLSKLTEEDNKFILLENVVAQFVQPCVLDLKMGIRQYGDDSSPDKRALLIQRCQDSTSGSLGVRLCGMQVFQADLDEYMFFNKYDGRAVNVDGFKDKLCQFLHNGYGLRFDLLDQVLDQLRSLYQVVSQQMTFRFYSSSLLILYEGAIGLTNASNENTVTSVNGGTQLPTPGEASSPVANAASLSNDGERISAKKSASLLCCNNDESGLSDFGESVSSSPDESMCSNNGESDAALSKPVSSRSAGELAPLKVEVRMVDFAHSTFQDFISGDAKHTGPHKGYLFGLGNLIKSFEEMKQRYGAGTDIVASQ